MAQEPPVTVDEDTPAPRPPRDWGRYWRTRILGAIVGLIALLGLGAVLLDSSIGHRFLSDSLASYAPASGLRVEVGRIDGSILSEAKLHDVVLSDPKGVFLRIPEVELDWRPLEWFTSGLDIRRLIARRGHLLRMPELNPGDPDAPLLPAFDIRVDRLEIRSLLVDEAVAGFSRRIDLWAQVGITDGRAKVNLLSHLGGEDRLLARLDASESENLLDLVVDYNASADGLLAGMIGADKDMRINIGGEGQFNDWKGFARVRQGEGNLAAFRLTKTGERYGIVGQAYPADYLTGAAANAVGKALSVRIGGTFENSVLGGIDAVFAGAGFQAVARGDVDLNGNRFDDFGISARLTDPDLFGPDLRAEGLIAHLGLSGDYKQDLAIAYRVDAERIAAGTAGVRGLGASGTASWDGTRLVLPVNATARAISTGSEMVDPRLVNSRLTGTLTYTGRELLSDDIVFDAPGLDARLALKGDVANGTYALTGPVLANGIALDGIGKADARARINAVLGGPQGYRLAAKVDGRLTRISNATIENLAGPVIGFDADIALAGGEPVLIRTARLNSRDLKLQISGRRDVDGTVRLAGQGSQSQYGPFTVDSVIDGAGPHAELVFASPLPAAGLKDVRVALAPSDDGFVIDTEGQSMLGPFAGTIDLVMPAQGPTTIGIRQLTVTDTNVTGDLALADGGVSGDLLLAGGGVDGTIALAPNAEGQGIDTDIVLRDARFTGDPPISVRLAHIKASGTLGDATTLDAAINAQGISRGNMFIGRFAAEGALKDGVGKFRAQLAGRRGSRVRMRFAGEVAQDRITLAARGRYAGRSLDMPRAVVLLRDDNGWNLQRSQINFAGGQLQAEGRFGDATELTVRVSKMPLDVASLLYDDLGLGGTASGIIDYADLPGSAPTGRARLLFDDLSRSGLVLTSRPVDIAMVAELTENDLETRAVIREDASRTGQLQARISALPAAGTLPERLLAGNLFAQLRYKGPADALWRLAAIETFDITGQVSLAGDVRGSLDNPQIRGTLRGSDLRLQSALTGTDIGKIGVRGSFDGAILRLHRFAGTASNGGTVSGSGSIDLSNLSTSGVGMDIRIAANRARVLGRDDMSAVVTGPIRVVAANNRGTIAGRLDMIEGTWKLGNADAAQSLPTIARTELNLPADQPQRTAASFPWRYLIDVSANNRFVVTGMGLDSEWGADIRLRGNTSAPILYGEANLVRGGYEFAGKRFELTKGRISFAGENPPDPRLDVVAEADINDISATIAIQGTAFAPQISFSSIPALPEEEVLSRLLFGDSVANISAPEALQLASALASMQGGGGGIDPINKLRGAIGVDRLRIVSADEALGRGTSVAVGEYLGRNLYAELVTDGRGYSATELEYRVTSWLSLLGTVSSLGYNSVAARASYDY